MNENSQWQCQYNQDGAVSVEHLRYPRFKVKAIVATGSANGAFSEWIDDGTDFAAIVISQFLADAIVEAKRFVDENLLNEQ